MTDQLPPPGAFAEREAAAEEKATEHLGSIRNMLAVIVILLLVLTVLVAMVAMGELSISVTA